jgi:hypothetical protein
MVRASLPRWIGYLGVVAGTLGIVSEALRPVIGAAYAGYGTLLLVWFVAVGIALCRLDRAQPEPVHPDQDRDQTPSSSP